MKKEIRWRGQKIRELRNRDLLHAYEDGCLTAMKAAHIHQAMLIHETLPIIRDELLKRMNEMSGHESDIAAANEATPDQTPESVQVSNANVDAENNASTGQANVSNGNGAVTSK